MFFKKTSQEPRRASGRCPLSSATDIGFHFDSSCDTLNATTRRQDESTSQDGGIMGSSSLENILSNYLKLKNSHIDTIWIYEFHPNFPNMTQCSWLPEESLASPGCLAWKEPPHLGREMFSCKSQWSQGTFWYIEFDGLVTGWFFNHFGGILWNSWDATTLKNRRIVACHPISADFEDSVVVWVLVCRASRKLRTKPPDGGDSNPISAALIAKSESPFSIALIPILGGQII